MPPDEQRLKDLTAELDALAQRTISRAFKRHLGNDPLPMPNLRAIARTVIGDVWQTAPADAFRQLIVLAAASLSVAPVHPASKMSYPELASIIFNLAGDSLDHVGGRHYRYLFDISKEAGLPHHGEDTWSNVIASLRKRIAVELIQLERDAQQRSQMKERSSVEIVDGYVCRTSYESWFLGHPRHVCSVLHGDAGTGKTELAARLARLRYPDKPVWVLRASDEDVFVEDIAEFVAACGVEPRDINATNVRVHFARILSSDVPPAVVVIDDIQDYSLVTFVPKKPRTTVIMTSMHRPPFALQEYSREVLDLSDGEAAAMARMNSAVEDPAAVHKLIYALGNRALAIEQACGYLAETGIQPAHLLAQLAKSPAETLRTLADPTDPHETVLTNIYELVLAELARFPSTLAVLDTFLFLDPYAVTEEHVAMLLAADGQADVAAVVHNTRYTERESCVGACIWKERQEVRPSDGSVTIVASAFRQLRKFSLIRYGMHGNPSMHSLTHRLLRELRDSQRQLVQERIIAAAYLMLRCERWHGGEALRLELARAVSHCTEALQEMTTSFEGREIATNVQMLIRSIYLHAALLRIYRQLSSARYVEFARVSYILIAVGIQKLKQPEPLQQHSDLESALLDLVAEHEEALVMAEYPQSAIQTSILRSYDLALIEPLSHSPTVHTLYLKHDTEWDPIDQVFHADRLVAYARGHAAIVNRRLGSLSIQELNDAARAAIWAASVSFQRAKWMDAIAALEHAASCFEKIAGDAESARGFMDVAWRLARVHLRRGQPFEAVAWVDRAHSFAEARSYKSANGQRRPYVADQLVKMRLSQQYLEAALTVRCIALDQAIEVDEAVLNEAADEHADYAVEVIQFVESAGFTRLYPEFVHYVLRVHGLWPSVRSRIPSITTIRQNMKKYSDASSGQFQRVLLYYLQRVMHLVGRSLIGDGQQWGQDAEASDESAAEGLTSAEQAAQSSGTTWDSFDSDVSTCIDFFGSRFNSPYWQAHALATQVVYGAVEGKNNAWIRRANEQFSVAVVRINREDWADRIVGFLKGQQGCLWLAGY